jgi:hypothetical protein
VPKKAKAKVIKLPTKSSKKKVAVSKSRPKKPHWFRMESFWEKNAQSVMKVGDEDIVLCGWVPPYNDVAVCLVPPSITQQQGLALQKILEANLRAPCLVLTSNTQLVRLKQIPEAEALRIMEEGAPDAIVQVTKEEGREEEGREEEEDQADESADRPA